MLSKEALLGECGTRVETVEVPEWGKLGQVRLRLLPAQYLDEFDSALVGSGPSGPKPPGGSKPPGGLRVERWGMVIARSLVDEKGQLLFETNEELQEATVALLKKPLVGYRRILTRVLEINGATKESQEDLGKNSEPGRGDG